MKKNIFGPSFKKGSKSAKKALKTHFAIALMDDDHHGEDHHHDVINNDELFDNLHWPPTVCVATRGSKQPRSKVLRGDGIGM